MSYVCMPTRMPAKKMTRIMDVWNHFLSRSVLNCLAHLSWRSLPKQPMGAAGSILKDCTSRCERIQLYRARCTPSLPPRTFFFLRRASAVELRLFREAEEMAAAARLLARPQPVRPALLPWQPPPAAHGNTYTGIVAGFGNGWNTEWTCQQPTRQPVRLAAISLCANQRPHDARATPSTCGGGTVRADAGVCVQTNALPSALPPLHCVQTNAGKQDVLRANTEANERWELSCRLRAEQARFDESDDR